MLIYRDCPYFDECIIDADIRGYDLHCRYCDVYLYRDEEEVEEEGEEQ